MSIRQILNVWDHEFPHPEQAVMLALADWAHEDGSHIYPSIALISWKTGYSKRQTQRIMRRLEESGVLVRVQEASQHKATLYRFDWSRATPKPPFEKPLRGDNLTPLGNSGVTSETSGVTSGASGVTSETPGVTSGASGVTPMSPDPLYEPLYNRYRSEERSDACACANSPPLLFSGEKNFQESIAVEAQLSEQPEQPIAPEDYPSHSEVASFAVLKKRVARDSTRPLAFDDAKWSQSYNRYKPDGWMPVALLAPADIAAVREAIGRVGSESEALQRFVLALSWVRVGGKDLQWWRDKKLQFSTLLNPQKQHFLSFSEAAKVANVNPDAIADSGMSDRQIQNAKAVARPSVFRALKRKYYG